MAQSKLSKRESATIDNLEKMIVGLQARLAPEFGLTLIVKGRIPSGQTCFWIIDQVPGHEMNIGRILPESEFLKCMDLNPGFYRQLISIHLQNGELALGTAKDASPTFLSQTISNLEEVLKGLGVSPEMIQKVLKSMRRIK